MAGESSVISPAATAAATGLSAGASVGGQLLNYGLQKSLLRNQYNEYISAAQKAGATPAAIAQGLTGSGASSTPSVSASPSMPDLASNLIQGSDIAASNQRREYLNAIDAQNLEWNPIKWNADIKRIQSEVGLNNSHIRTNKALFGYYQELGKDIRLKRPWQIQQLQQGINNMLAEYQKILAETETVRKQGNYFDSAAFNQWNEGYNKSLESFGIMFDNTMRAAGWNPNSDAMDNIKRIAFTDPKGFKALWDSVKQTLGVVDNEMKDQFGKNYKRNAAMLAGAYFGNRAFQRGKDRFLNRLVTASQVVGNIMPLAHPSAPAPLQFSVPSPYFSYPSF